MRLLEYQGRFLFDEMGINLPMGKVIKDPQEAAEFSRGEDRDIFLKAQVPVGGRGKAGGIKRAKNPSEAIKRAEELFEKKIKGETVRKVLAVRAVEVEKELYLGILLNRKTKKPVVIFSTKGGVDIEEVADQSPEQIQKFEVDPLLGIRPFQIREALYKAGIGSEHFKVLYNVIQDLYQGFSNYEATLMEINPLAINNKNEIYALDSKVVIDDESKRIEEIKDIAIKGNNFDQKDSLEKKAEMIGLQYVELDGNIGVIGNGAGLVMSTLDMISENGGAPANFLDIGGGADADKMKNAYQLVISKKEVEAVFINIFGGITRCDEVAKGLIAALDSSSSKIPLVVRLTGTNVKEGVKIMQKYGIKSYTSMIEGVKSVINAV